ncbi:carbonyl reductase [NADPH] 1-like [Diadema antillarum]|uniref:carbonyl reductase [NADPH] 1-like n=1 Tax=Diadema antillarum TaxID=105358 RepID=UPI003A85B150
MASRRVALVTGSQQGIGLAIVRALCRQLGESGTVYLTALDSGRRDEAVASLKAEGLNPVSRMLDVTDQNSIDAIRDDIAKQYGGLDILVNNAAIAYLDNSIPMSVQAENTMKVNFYGIVNMTKTLMPLIRDRGRIVNVCSRGGVQAFNKLTPELQKRFKDVATEQGVIDLMEEFLQATKRGDHMERGWPDWAYGTSKLGSITLTRVQGQTMADSQAQRDILINCCHPGYVDTPMTAHHSAERAKNRITVEEGADTPVYLSLLPPGTTGIQGCFLSRRTIYDFFNNPVDHSKL